MPEVAQGLMALAGLFLAAVSSFLWMLGGRSQSELDRFNIPFKARTWGRLIAPIFFGAGLIILSLLSGRFQWWDLAIFPLLKAVSHLGHGGDTFLEKLARRTANGALWVLPAALLCILHGGWWIALTHLIISVSASVLWGIDNPRVAPTEEVKINFCKIVSYPFYLIV